MEHNELDKLFRRVIDEDNSDLNKEEIEAKGRIWTQLERPAEGQRLHFWRIAAAILFLLLGSLSVIMISKIDAQQKELARLQKDYLQTKNALLLVEDQLEKNRMASNNGLIANPPVIEDESLTTLNTGKVNINTPIYIRDTVWVEKNNITNEMAKLVRDTVFIEVPIARPERWTAIESSPQKAPSTLPKKKQPSKVEFVFGKKPLEKPTRKIDVFITDEDVAKKTEQEKSGKTTIRINN